MEEDGPDTAIRSAKFVPSFIPRDSVMLRPEVRIVSVAEATIPAVLSATISSKISGLAGVDQ